MARGTQAKVGDATIKCPVCGGSEFRTKKFQLVGSWLQSLDLEAFGRDALMLICEHCGYVLHFARPSAISMYEQTPGILQEMKSKDTPPMKIDRP